MRDLKISQETLSPGIRRCEVEETAWAWKAHSRQLVLVRVLAGRYECVCHWQEAPETTLPIQLTEPQYPSFASSI